jgi:DNA-binding NarL/FixJ family response regulator
MVPTPPLPKPETSLARVLIVDDSPTVLRDLRLLLELSEAIEIVAEAQDGEEAVRLAATLSPEVVVMDLDMPNMDGYEATRRIKSHTPAMRVIILSVHDSPEEQQHARAAGADDFVTKGASYEVLVNTILVRGGATASLNPGK